MSVGCGFRPPFPGFRISLCVPATLTSVLVGLGDLCQQLHLLGTVLELAGPFPLLARSHPFPDYLHDFLINHPVGKMVRNAKLHQGVRTPSGMSALAFSDGP